MTIRLDHTIVPAKDKVVSAEFFAEIFGLRVKPGQGHFTQVQVNESLTFDFADEAEPWGGRVSTRGRLGAITTLSMSARWSSRRSSAGCRLRGFPMAAGHSTTPMVSSTPAGAGVASTLRTLTATCWKS